MPHATWPELVESARALRDAAGGLAGHLPADAPERFRTAAAQVAQRAGEFARVVDRPEPPDLKDRLLRHDLRAHLALVIGYAELWLKRRTQEGISPHLADLETIARGARLALELLDGIASGTGGGPVPKPAAAPMASPLAPQRLPAEVGQ